MDLITIKHAGVLLIGVFISSISQVLLKKSAMRKYNSLIREYLNPMVIIAYMMIMAAVFLTILAYKGIPLSMGPVLEATSYIYVAIFGVKIFKEKMNIYKYVALGLIMMGIIVYSFWG